MHSILRTIGGSTLVGLNWLRRNVLSTSRHAVQVLVVDAVAAFAMSYLLVLTVAVVLWDVPLTWYWPQPATTALMVFMALLGGLIGFNSARERQRNLTTHHRSWIATIAWTFGTPVAAVATIAIMVQDPDPRSALTVLAQVGPGLAVFGYRLMGFRPNSGGMFARLRTIATTADKH